MKELKHISGKGTLLYFSCEISGEEFLQWLTNYSNHVKSNISHLQRLGLEDVIVINDLFVDTEAKGQGIGKSLLIEFLGRHSNKKIILIAEAFGSNDINLEEWYSRYGFKTVLGVVAGPLMLKD
jgi:N-acetylglutamate synthase-like GNAT family acetyltransferase